MAVDYYQVLARMINDNNWNDDKVVRLLLQAADENETFGAQVLAALRRYEVSEPFSEGRGSDREDFHSDC